MWGSELVWASAWLNLCLSEERLAEERTCMPQMLIGEWQQDALGTI